MRINNNALIGATRALSYLALATALLSAFLNLIEWVFEHWTRTAIAVTVCAVLFVIWDAFRKPPVPTAAPNNAAAETEATEAR